MIFLSDIIHTVCDLKEFSKKVGLSCRYPFVMN